MEGMDLFVSRLMLHLVDRWLMEHTEFPLQHNRQLSLSVIYLEKLLVVITKSDT